MRNVLLTGLSATALVVGLSIPMTSASAGQIDGLYGVVDATAVETEDEGNTYVFTADGTLSLADGTSVGSGRAAESSDEFDQKSNSGAWENGVGTAVDRTVSDTQAIVTTTDNRGIVDGSALTTLGHGEGPYAIAGDIGDATNALKTLKGGDEVDLVTGGNAYLGSVDVGGADVDITGTLSGAGANVSDVNFKGDGTLYVGDTATIGDVNVTTDGEGTLLLDGNNNVIADITGNKLGVLEVSGDAEGTGGDALTTLKATTTGINEVRINAENTLKLDGAGPFDLDKTLVGNTGVLDIGDAAVVGDVLGVGRGSSGTVVIGAGTGGKTVDSVTGDIGSALQGLELVHYKGAATDTHSVIGDTYTDDVWMDGAGTLDLRGLLAGATDPGADVAFAEDGTLKVGDDATVGTVLTDAANTTGKGTLSLSGETNIIDAIAGGLKALVLGGTPGSSTTLGGTDEFGVATASVANGNTLIVTGDSTIGTTTLTGSDSALDMQGADLFGTVKATSDGDGSITLGGIAENTIYDGVGSASEAIGSITSTGSEMQTIIGDVYTKQVNVSGTGTLWVGSEIAGSNGGGAAVNFGADGTLLSAGGALDAVTTAANGTGTLGLFKDGVATVAQGVGASGLALKHVGLDSGASLSSMEGVYTKKTSLGVGALLAAGDDSKLGALTADLDYDTAGKAFRLGQVTAGAGVADLDVSSLTVNASGTVLGGLGNEWNKRTSGDTAVNVGDILTFANLTKDGTVVGFDAAEQKAGGLSYGTTKDLLVSDNLALWNFALGQTGGADANLLAVQDAAGFRNSIAAGGTNMSVFGGVADGMLSVVNDTKADPTLQNFINGLTTGETATVAQQMADTSVNNSVVGAVGMASRAASNAISTNIGGVGSNTVASNGLVSGINAGDVGKRNTAWLQVIGSWNDQGRRKGVDGYSADTYGFALGADTLVSETTRLGLALHYANTNIDGKGVFSQNNSKVNTYGVTLYGQQNLTDALFLDGRLGYAYNDVSSKRHVNGLDGKADGSYGAHQFDVSAKLGYNAKVASNTTLTPHIGLGYTYLGENSYTESGNAARLHVGSRDTNALLIGAGVRGAVEFATADKTKIVPEIRLGASYDALASDFATTARFIGGGTAFTTRNVKPDPWTFNVGAGVNVVTTGNFTVSANYDAALSGNFTGHTGSLRGKLKF